MNQYISHTSFGAKAHAENVVQSESPVQEAVTMCISTQISDVFVRKPPEKISCCWGKKKIENSFMLRQNFLHFPHVFLKPQVYSLEKILEFFISTLP